MFCIPIIAGETEEALNKMTEAKDLADIFEIRLDLMKTFNIATLIQASPKPVLVTYRSKAEGGEGSADFPTIADYLNQAIQAGAALVDVEKLLPETLRQKVSDSRASTHVVLSTHITDTPLLVWIFNLFLMRVLPQAQTSSRSLPGQKNGRII
jgi:3-dehydroquinate dehydratase type I